MENEVNKTLKICTYNCKNFKGNTLMIKKLIQNHDICFFSEHWLDSNEKYFFDDVAEQHHIFYQADMVNRNLIQGRPFGGICWVIKNSIEIVSQNFFNNKVSCIELNDNGKHLFVYGAWMPFDNKKSENDNTYQSYLSLIEGQIKNNKGSMNLVIGDFNSDINRGNKFDCYLRKFISKCKLFSCTENKNKDNFTYQNGNYKSTIDYILLSNNSKKNLVTSEIIFDILDCSDHKPISASIKITSLNRKIEHHSSINNKNKFHKFPWKDADFIGSFKEILVNNLSNIEYFSNNNSNSPKELIDENLKLLTKTLLKSARQAEKTINGEISNVRKIQKTRNDKELSFLVSKLRKLNYEVRLNNVFSRQKSIEYKKLKKDFRKAQRLKIFNHTKNNSIKLENFLKLDKDKFWRTIKKSRTSNKSNQVNNITLNEFADYYSKLFSHIDKPSNVSQIQVEENIETLYNNIKHTDLKNTNFFSNFQIESVIKDLKIGKSCGFDNISNEMIKYGKCSYLVNLLNIIFNNMIRFGHTPSEFNISVVTPIPKKSELNTPSDYRPISVSSVFTLIYEALINNKINLNSHISNNQFGYKPGTSCKHAYFVANETINYFMSQKTSMHIASLDASKAFDKLWRAGLFYKLRDKIPVEYWRAIKSYYNESQIVVKLNNEKSDIYTTTEGVKQGSILSGFMFNFFIDDLLRESLNYQIGAKMGEKNLSAIAYCDDIMLLSPSVTHLKKLIKISENYAAKWKITFNSNKSIYYCNDPCIKSNNIIKMDNTLLNKEDGFIYLGLPIGNNEYKEDFIENKFKKTERSFYSLYKLGCKPYALCPRTIAFIYKQFCQSIFKYGLEVLFLSNKKIDNFNIRQNILIKQAIGISKYTRTKPLFQILKIESIMQLYCKHKIYFIKQLKKNSLTNEIYDWLDSKYIEKKTKPSKNSFVAQIKIVSQVIKCHCLINLTETLNKIEKLFFITNNGLLDTISFIISNFYLDRQYFKLTKLLNKFLNYSN